ncbi:autotransporter outer membrane beta-barrel domain-containing protein [Mannheimia granulomatis]|uniref:autotransporter outer membrane beta-barrel domain-containing protein n=1 Tax=Mannheimia granulomatis TaxID=85402 RepID=UPI001EEDA366|nr:autotransporter outer membrane beta-barrel domain-containing protein [Mannheimia granulomatis]
MKNFKLSPITLVLISVGMAASTAQAANCENMTITEGFAAKDQTIQSNTCTYDLSGTNTQDPEIELKGTNAVFDNATVLGDGSKKSKRYWRFGSNIDLFSVLDNSSAVFNNSTLSLNSLDSERSTNNLLDVDKSTLTLNHTKLTHNSGGNAKIVYAENNATVNINNSELKSSTPENISTFYSNVVQVNGLNNSTINVMNSTLSSHNDSRLIYLNNSTLNLSSSKLSNTGKKNGGDMISAIKSNAIIKDSSVNLTESDTIIDATDSTFTITNSTLAHTKEVAGESSFFVNGNILLKNTTMNIKDSTITNKNGDGIFIVGNSTLSITNTKADANKSKAFLFGEDRSDADGNSKIIIKDSTLKAERGFIPIDSRATTNLDIQLENSTIETTALRFEGRYNPGNHQLTSKNSELSGYIDDAKMSVELNDSTWTYSSDLARDIKDLSGNNSEINIEKSQYFSNLVINGNLSGNLHFGLNTDLASEKGNSVIVKGKSDGKHTITVKDSGNEPKAEGGKLTLVKTTDGIAAFSLKDKDFVDAGAYRYHLNKEGTDWVLSNKVTPKEDPNEPTQPIVPVSPEPTPAKPADPVPPVEPTTPPAKPAQPVTPPTVTPAIPISPSQPAVPTSPSVPTTRPALAELSETSNALVLLRQAQGLLLTQNLQGIHQRLGELKTDKAGNVWVKNINSRTEAKAQNVAADSRSSGFEMDSHSLQIGADRAVSDNFRLGGFVGTSRADVDFNGEYGKGKLRSQAVGFYATFANADGWYVDNIGKYERLTAQASNEKRKYNAFSLSSEVGKRIALSNDWTVTPQAQLAYHTINGKADESRLSLFTARAGVRVGKGFAFANGWHLQPYAELNAIAEKANNAKVRVNQYQFDVPENRGRFQTSIGFTAGNGSHRVGLEASTTHGKQLKQPISILANYRYQW